MTIDLESWQAIGGAVGILLVAAYGRWEQRRTRKTAQKAVDQTVATGNGFAKDVRDSLARLQAGQVRNDRANARIEKKIDDHITAHANAGLATHPRRVLRDVNEL